MDGETASTQNPKLETQNYLRHPPIAVQFQQYPDHQAEPNQRRTAVTDEGQRDADDGKNAHGHPHIDYKVYKYNTGNTISVSPWKIGALPFCQGRNPE